MSPGGQASPQRATLYWSAVWRAAVTTATFALPLGLFQQWLIDSDRISKSDPSNYLIYFAILFCGALGGYAAAKLAPDSWQQNGAAAAALATFTIQVAGAIRHMIVGEDISSPLGWIFLALLMATCAMFGARVHRAMTPKNSGADRP